MRAFRQFLTLTAAAAGVLGAGAGTAHAALSWIPCSPSGFQCTTLDVPLARDGAVPGQLKLSAHRAPAAAPGGTAVVALAGGPGQAAQPLSASFAKALAPLLRTRDLLVPDQRGTGRSDPLRCAALRSGAAGSIAEAVARCAAQVGPQRDYYLSVDSAEDLEALRVAGGYSKLLLYGVSYGTKVALDYAALHPATTEALVLDSVVTPDGPDALRRSTLRAIPRVLTQDLCTANACRGISADPVRDVRALAARLAKRPQIAQVVTGTGRRVKAGINASGLADVLVAGDLDPTLRADLPGAMRSALNGDGVPLLRLAARGEGLTDAAHFQSSDTTLDALYFATLCGESQTLPWPRDAKLAARPRAALKLLEQQPASAFGPFPRGVALSGIPTLCLGWPSPARAVSVPATLPDVPVLVLDGFSDLRTPVEDAQTVTVKFPRGQLVGVPHTGHSVLGSDPGTCAKNALGTFASQLQSGTTAPIGACPAVRNPFPPTPRPPASLARVATVRGLTPKIGRTLNAVGATLNDARRQILGATIARGAVPHSVGGLRGGHVSVRRTGTFLLRGYEYVPGVRVTGSFRPKVASTVFVTGPKAAYGSLTFSADGRTVRGRLDGRRISASSSRALRAATSGPAALPSLAEALRRGRLVARAG